VEIVLLLAVLVGARDVHRAGHALEARGEEGIEQEAAVVKGELQSASKQSPWFGGGGHMHIHTPQDTATDRDMIRLGDCSGLDRNGSTLLAVRLARA
jgi:hypothetical protein